MSGFSLGPLEFEFVTMLVLSVVLGFIIGAERESRGKDAGIGTHILVISGAALFTLISSLVDPMSTSRISAQIVAGIGFLGAGLIIRDGGNVKNLTTAASLWVAAGVGMALGYGFYMIAIITAILAAVAPRIPHLHTRNSDENHTH
jgi:putative Mg2+ transporter-C (MgtC) family protein